MVRILLIVSLLSCALALPGQTRFRWSQLPAAPAQGYILRSSGVNGDYTDSLRFLGGQLQINGGLQVSNVTALTGDSVLVWRGNRVYLRDGNEFDNQTLSISEGYDFEVIADGNDGVLWDGSNILGYGTAGVRSINISIAGGNTISFRDEDRQRLSVSDYSVNFTLLVDGSNGTLWDGTIVLADSAAGDQNYIALTISNGNTVMIPTGSTSTMAANLGGGTGLYAQKDANELQFKSIQAGSNITVSSSSTEVTISAPAYYADMYITQADQDTIATDGNSFYRVEDWTAGLSSGFTLADTIVYTATPATVRRVLATLSYVSPDTGFDTGIRVYKNGANLPGCEFLRQYTTTAAEQIQCSCLVSLTTGDYLELRIQTKVSTTIRILNANFSIQ